MPQCNVAERTLEHCPLHYSAPECCPLCHIALGHCPLHYMCSSRAQCPSLAPSIQKILECPLFTSFALEHRDLHSYPQLTSDAYQRHWSLHVEELSTPLLHEQQRRPLYSTAAQAVEKTTFLHPMCSSGEGQSTLPFLCCSTSSRVEASTLLCCLCWSRVEASTPLCCLCWSGVEASTPLCCLCWSEVEASPPLCCLC